MFATTRRLCRARETASANPDGGDLGEEHHGRCPGLGERHRQDVAEQDEEQHRSVVVRRGGHGGADSPHQREVIAAAVTVRHAGTPPSVPGLRWRGRVAGVPTWLACPRVER